ncbi:MAG TPA: EAL domain-containing protein [Acidobacteriaceae bacterium]
MGPEVAVADLSALIESSQDFIWSVDLDYRLLTFNGALQRDIADRFGVAPALGKRAAEIMPPEVAAIWPALYERALSEGHVCTELNMPDGRILEVVLNLMLVAEKVRGIAAFARDITHWKIAEHALLEVEKKYRAIFDGAIEGVYRTSLDGKLLVVNRALLRMLGYDLSPDKAVVAITAREIWVDLDERVKLLKQLEEAGSVQGLECQFKRQDGNLIWVALSCRLVREENGETCIDGFVEDISERKRAEEELRESEDRYRSAFQTSLDAININRLSDGRYIDVNDAFLRIMGFSREEVLGRTSLELEIWKNPLDRMKMVEELRQHRCCRDMEVQFQKRNGQVLWGQISASVIELEGELCILSVTRDVSEAKLAEDEIRHLAFYDMLTGLPNRRLLLDRLGQAQAASGRSNCQHALLFVDLDDFKMLNDTLGHPVGDLQLQEVARRLSLCVRETDTVARFGGDEFVVILEDLSVVPEDAASQARVVAEKILGAVAEPYLLNRREHRGTSSIGITLFGNQSQSMDEVLKQADIAMYQAKAAGRNTMRFFAPALQAAVNARAALEEELRNAIHEGQFVLYYQPQLNHSDVNGAEALLRWNHPKRGLLPPSEFIPSAEETGLILPLGDWVLETACTQLAIWATSNELAHITVAVNISARQLRQTNFVEQVLAVLERTGANPQNLRLELTESVVVDKVDEVIAKMTALRMHGVKFSLDDFGTGYSSLTYLKRLPLDQLKIDRSFVRDILVDAGSGAIAETIISLSRALGLLVIAEGVETEEQRRFLTRMRCYSFQGFLFSRPLPKDDFEELVRKMEQKIGGSPLFD